MDQNSPTTPPDRTEQRERRWPGLLLVLPFPIAVFWLAAVHPMPRAVVGILCAMTGLAGWTLTRESRRLPRESSVVVVSALAALWSSSIAFLPISNDIRASLQPGLAHPIEPILALAEVTTHPVAINPHQAALAWGWAAACLALCIGVSTVFRTRLRSLRLAFSIVLTGVGLVLLHGVQNLVDAESIYWISGIPVDSREAFYATFVNPNHAGILLAAILPIAFGLTRRGDGFQRAMAWLAFAVLAFGVWSTGSRGAVLAAAGGLFMIAMVLGRPQIRLGLLAAASLVSLLIIFVGPERVFVRLSERWMPDSLAQDSWSLRPEIWSDAFDLAVRSPWVGVGMGGFADGFTLVKSSTQFSSTSHAHNEVLQVFAETGFPIGLLWIFVIAAPAWVGWRHASELGPGRRQQLTASFIGAHTALMIGCLCDFPLRIGAISVLLAAICGILLARPGSKRTAASRPLGRLIRFGIWTAVLVSALPLLALNRSTGILQSTDSLLEDSDLRWENSVENQIHESGVMATEGLGLAPLDHRFLLRRARAELALGAVDDALYTLNLAQQVYPTLPWPWISTARIHSDRGESESARVAWNTGLSLDLPTTEDGSSLIREALADAPTRESVLAMVPERADRLRDAAAIVSAVGDQSLARRLFVRATELDPRVHLAYANHQLRWDDPEGAWSSIQQVPNQDCGTVRTGGRILLELGRAQEAVSRLIRALGRCGARDNETLRALAAARVATQHTDAFPLLERLLAEYPEDLELRILHIRALRDHRRYEEILPLLEALVLEGRASDAHMEDLLRLYEGLPLR